MRAPTASRSALSEYARTTARLARRRRWGTTPSRSGVGEYSEGTHGRTAIVCTGEWCGRARPPTPRIRYSNGSRSMVRLRDYSQGTGRGTRGVLLGPCVDRSARGSGRRRARHLQWGRTEYEHARGTANHTEYPTALGHCRRLLPARVRARQCDGACRRTQGCLTDTNGPGRSHACARRGIARGAGAQIFQQVERRQRGGDRAVQRV